MTGLIYKPAKLLLPPFGMGLANAIQFYDSKILFGDSEGNNTDKIAFHEDCCCGEDCTTDASCFEGADCTTNDILLTLPAEFVNDQCDECEELGGEYVLEWTDGCTWAYTEGSDCLCGGLQVSNWMLVFWLECTESNRCDANAYLYLASGLGKHRWNWSRGNYDAGGSAWTMDYSVFESEHNCDACDETEYPATITAELIP